MDLLHHTEEITVPCRPEEAWTLLSDLPSHPRLGGSGEVQTLRVLDPGPLRAGTRFAATEVVHIGPKVFELGQVTSTVQTVEPGRLLVWRTDSPEEFGKPTVKLIEWSFSLRGSDGGTVVSHSLRMQLTSGWLTPLFLPFFALVRGNKVKRGMAETLRRVSAELAPVAPGATTA